MDLKGNGSSQLNQCRRPGPHLVRCDSAPPALTTLKLLALEKGFYHPFSLLADTLWMVMGRDGLGTHTTECDDTAVGTSSCGCMQQHGWVSQTIPNERNQAHMRIYCVFRCKTTNWQN